MLETDKSYIAGLVDGEGHIRIRRLRNQGLGSGYIGVCVYNTNKAMIDYISIRFRGKVSCRSRNTEKNHKPAWGWEANGENAKIFLRAVMPYLIIKKKQAELALSFRQIQENTPRNGKNRVLGLSDMSHVPEREFLMEQIDLLNHRGIN